MRRNLCLPIDIEQFVLCLPSHACLTPAGQSSLRHLKSNLSLSGHQTNSKCQWWISFWVAWQSGILLMYQTPLIFIWCDRKWRACCWSIPLCAGNLVCRGRGMARARWDPIWTDPASCQLSPQWLGMLPTHQQPSKGACPPAHPEWAARSMSPSPHYWQKEAKAGTTQSFNHPQVPG